MNIEKKQIIRKELLKKRNSLTEEDCKNYSKMITKQLLSLTKYQKSESILIYASYLSEVSTFEIVEQALNSNKKVFCPKVLSPGIMEFYKIVSLEDIILGYKNIPEPKLPEFPFQTEDTSQALMIMPLVGFDTYKNRLGYGGGFYDRYLQRFPNLERIGLAFECQRCNYLPTEETDQKLDFIITEKGIF